jgi:hypothetical protein
MDGLDLVPDKRVPDVSSNQCGHLVDCAVRRFPIQGQPLDRIGLGFAPLASLEARPSATRDLGEPRVIGEIRRLDGVGGLVGECRGDHVVSES